MSLGFHFFFSPFLSSPAVSCARLIGMLCRFGVLTAKFSSAIPISTHGAGFCLLFLFFCFLVSSF